MARSPFLVRQAVLDVVARRAAKREVPVSFGDYLETWRLRILRARQIANRKSKANKTIDLPRARRESIVAHHPTAPA